jgi:antitoxin (DNA-binding transcriptional repressor) of toxin-antitoxin stability system
MKATVVDLRYKMNDVLKALDRNEKVTVLYRGKVKGTLVPAKKQKKNLKISEHPFFGMFSQDKETSVTEELNKLRGSRYDDI